MDAFLFVSMRNLDSMAPIAANPQQEPHNCWCFATVTFPLAFQSSTLGRVCSSCLLWAGASCLQRGHTRRRVTDECPGTTPGAGTGPECIWCPAVAHRLMRHFCTVSVSFTPGIVVSTCSLNCSWVRSENSVSPEKQGTHTRDWRAGTHEKHVAQLASVMHAPTSADLE